MSCANISLSHHLGIVSNHNYSVLNGAPIPHVITDNASITVLNDHTVVRTPSALAVIIASASEGIARKHYVVRLGYADVSTVIDVTKRRTEPMGDVLIGEIL